MLEPIWRKVSSPGLNPRVEERAQPRPEWPAVLFVCTANRIRSPLAEYMLLDLLQRRAHHQPWRVESAGVWAQDGLPVLDAVYQAGLEFGLDLGDHRARAVAALNLQQFDLILAMERKHAATLYNEFPQLRSRIMTLGEAVSGYEFEIVDPPRHAPRAVKATAKELAELLAWGVDALQERLQALRQQRRIGALHN
jgi:protein-tyrosine-phosphatase